MTNKPQPDSSPVTTDVCNALHEGTKTSISRVIKWGAAIVVVMATVAGVFLNRQFVISDATHEFARQAREAVHSVGVEADKAEREREHIKRDIQGVKVEVDKVSMKQDEINMSLRLLIQKVEDNGGTK